MDKNLIVKTARCLGAASVSVLLGLPALAQSQLNPNPSIFNEAPYSRTRGLTIDQTRTENQNNGQMNNQMNNSGTSNEAVTGPNESRQQQPSTAPERNRTSSDDPRVFTPGSQPTNAPTNSKDSTEMKRDRSNLQSQTTNDGGQAQPSAAPERNRTSSDDPRTFTPGSQPGTSGGSTMDRNTNQVPSRSPSGTEATPNVNSGTTDRQRSEQGGSSTPVEQRTRTEQIQQQTSPGTSNSPAGSFESSPSSVENGSSGQAVQGLW